MIHNHKSFWRTLIVKYFVPTVTLVHTSLFVCLFVFLHIADRLIFSNLWFQLETNVSYQNSKEFEIRNSKWLKNYLKGIGFKFKLKEGGKEDITIFPACLTWNSSEWVLVELKNARNFVKVAHGFLASNRSYRCQTILTFLLCLYSGPGKVFCRLGWTR